MNKYEKDRTFEHVVTYVLLKKKSFGDVAMREIIYMADVHSLLMNNKPVTGDLFLYPNSYELSDVSIKKMMHQKNQLLMKYKEENELESLSDNDKLSLDFAIDKYNSELCVLPDNIIKKNN
jgi:hypothetical protein